VVLVVAVGRVLGVRNDGYLVLASFHQSLGGGFGRSRGGRGAGHVHVLVAVLSRSSGRCGCDVRSEELRWWSGHCESLHGHHGFPLFGEYLVVADGHGYLGLGRGYETRYKERGLRLERGLWQESGLWLEFGSRVRRQQTGVHGGVLVFWVVARRFGGLQHRHRVDGLGRVVVVLRRYVYRCGRGRSRRGGSGGRGGRGGRRRR